ncbi:DUF2785 domain-containing protein [uncultured Paraglaciecola sp.]|uniref:DUF2785 domain-containing protein n=1 Tax=uncultured Paraglaciecola sp. TaxID=1765024 RepID=UPI00260F1965|nr:DUF2785 domain-containing protein [uncultured Paraglaciecola sp.]
MKFQIIVSCLLWIIPAMVQANPCKANFTTLALKTLKKDNFVIESPEQRNQTALRLLTCLGDPDPKVRDGLVYEAISHWLRNASLSDSTVKSMFELLIDKLQQPSVDPLKFTQPFAALVLSEVLRVDRITPYLLDTERQKAIEVSTSYMSHIKDYRGFDDKQGWRHGVAHTADIFLQLSLNSKITKAQLNQLLEGIKSQVSPQNSHFYIYGEPKRLAMPFMYIALRGEHSLKELSSFLETVIDPMPYENWQSVYQSNQGLAKLHNTRHFIYSILALSEQSENPTIKALKPKLVELIQTLG